MKILVVGGIQERTAASNFYGTVQKLINGFTRNGHTVVYFSDRDVSRYSNLFKSRKFGVSRCNHRLYEVVKEFRPHLIVFKHADVIQAETLEAIKEWDSSIKMAQVNVDALFNADNVKRVRSKSGLVDANFLTTAGKGLKKVQVNKKPVFFIPNPVDKSIETGRAFESDCQYDVFFACGHALPGDHRYDFPKKLKENLSNYKIHRHMSSEGTGLRGDAYYDVLCNSKCGLNLSRKADKDNPIVQEFLKAYSSDRIAQYMGNGLLTFCEDIFSLDCLFNEDEFVTFRGFEDLQNKVEYYLTHEKRLREVARNGWKKSHDLYNEKAVSSFILQATFGDIESTFGWDTKGV